MQINNVLDKHQKKLLLKSPYYKQLVFESIMKKNTFKISIFFLLLMSFLGFSQTELQKKIIQKESNKEALLYIIDRLKKEHNENYSKTLDFAKKKGWKKRYTDSLGNFYELKEVTKNGYPLYYTSSNVGSAFTSRANKLMPNGGLGLNLTGKNLYVGVWDQDNAKINHKDFGGRAFVFDNNTNPIAYHSTHVTGTIISSGANSSQGSGRGIAYESYAYISNWTNDIAEMATLANNNGLLLSNHSYGLAAADATFPEYIFGAYRPDSRNLDEVTFNAPYYQPVIAAGNDRNKSPNINATKQGYDLLTGFSTAKNAIVVAAVAELSATGYTGPMDVVMSNFSSWGPTDDNRIKPDIAMKGIGVYSTSDAADNISYGTLSGTSMAAPGVTGTLLLLQEHFLNNSTENFMRSATLRGLIIHTADEAGEADGPDPRFGWGLLNAEKAAVLITNAFQGAKKSTIQEFDSRASTDPALSNGGTYIKTVKASGSESLIATLSWTDRAGIANTGTLDLKDPVLINDLDIRITKGPVTYFPWRLNESKSLPAIKADNNVDNVEKIEVKDAAEGLYTITVTHKGNLTGGSQDFSLIVSGIDQNNLALNELEIKTIKVWPNPTFGKVNVSLQSDSSEDADISVYTLLGQRIIHKKLNVSNGEVYGEINLEKYSSGVFFIRIIQGMKESTLKIVKK